MVVCGSAIRNFVTDILMTLAIRNICVLKPKMCLPKRTPKAPFLPNFSSILRGVLKFPGLRIWLLLLFGQYPITVDTKVEGTDLIRIKPQKLCKSFIFFSLAISMPIDLDRSNRMIVKRIINKWSLSEGKRSDTSR